MGTVVFLSSVYSWFLGWFISRLEGRRAPRVVALLVLPIFVSLLVSFRDPPNSFSLFIQHSFVSLIFTLFIYFSYRLKRIDPEKQTDPDDEKQSAKNEGTWSFGKSLLWALIVPAFVIMAISSVFRF